MKLLSGLSAHECVLNYTDTKEIQKKTNKQNPQYNKKQLTTF